MSVAVTLYLVNQSDRDMAAKHYTFIQTQIKTPHSADLQKRTIKELKSGRWDADRAVQDFAEHRIKSGKASS